MTCIAALKHGKDVYMIGDSASVGVSSLYSRITKYPKVFRNGEYVMGYTSSFRMGQLLQYKAHLPKPHDNLHEFMCTDFIDTVRQTMKDNGFATIRDNEETIGDFLVAVKGEIFEIQGDMQIGAYAEPYAVVGCGREYALAVLHALQGSFMSPKKKLIKALEAAEHFSIGVRSPFTIIKA